MAVSNHQFAAKVGCNYTMASRLRNGKRTPSAQMLVKICNAFSLDYGEALEAYSGGKDTLVAWLNANVFDEKEAEAEAEAEAEDPAPVG